MKAFFPSLFILSISFASAPATTDKWPSGNWKAKAKNLFIIVADGMLYDDVLGNKSHLYTENIWTKLRPLGTICANFRNTGHTYPLPAQASLLTGTWQVPKNPLCDTLRPAFPTLFEYWRKNERSVCYFAVNKKQFGILTRSDSPEYGTVFAPVFDTATSGDADSVLRDGATEIKGNAIYKKAVSYIFHNHPSFVYLNLDSGKANEAELYTHECKLANKAGGCEGEANLLNRYYESIILTDAIVFDLWDRIQRDEIYRGKSIFIFLSAHGRHTDDFHGFGDKCKGCQQLNFLIIGPGVKKDFISKKKRTLIDICPTVGALFDIPTPYAKGKLIGEILD
jgi:hypothetical protein